MQLTRKRNKEIHASYTLEGTDLENVESIKYLGVTITNYLTWNTHVSNVCTKANRTLGLLRRNLHSCPQEVKRSSLQRIGAPGPGVWQFSLGPPRCSSSERIRKRAKARSQIRDRKLQIWNWEYDWHFWTVKMGILQESRKDNRLVLLYKGLKGKASIPTDDLIPKTRCGRNQHSKAFQTPIANTDVYKCIFFPRLSGIGMSSPILWSHLLKMQRIMLLNLLLWWELGTSFLRLSLPGDYRVTDEALLAEPT